MKPLVFVIVQLAAIAWIFVTQVRHNPSGIYRSLYVAAFLGVAGFDAWYFANFAYPDGFAF